MAIDLPGRHTHPGLVLCSELTEAATNHGFRKDTGVADGWHYFRSDEGVPGEVGLSAGTGAGGAPWFLAIEHAGVAAQMRGEYPAAVVEPPPGRLRACFAFAEQPQMRAALSRAFHLARSLPTFPLVQFEDEVAGLGNTEVDRIVRQRVGQGYFRNALLDYWQGKCPITGVREAALLRASHIVPWAHCTSDAERLDVFNGLLLAAHWDAAFDAGLVSFADDGTALVKPGLDAAALALLAPDAAPPLVLSPQHCAKLAWHRAHFGFV